MTYLKIVHILDSQANGIQIDSSENYNHFSLLDTVNMLVISVGHLGNLDHTPGHIICTGTLLGRGYIPLLPEGKTDALLNQQPHHFDVQENSDTLSYCTQDLYTLEK